MVKHMARKAKTPKHQSFNSSPNSFGERQAHDGKWNDYLPAYNKNLTLEVGCGRAELALELARLYPKQNFIGIDKKSDRMWRPAKTAIEEKLKNIAFIQTDFRKIEEFIPENSVDTIWITFPDPYPRGKHVKNRLINQRFMDTYKKLLKDDGVIRFKTDDNDLFEFFQDEVITKRKDIKIIAETRDLHESNLNEDYKILTTYETKWIEMGRKINFVELKFS